MPMSDGANLERNKAVARRFFTEVWGGGSEETAEELLSPEYLGHLAGSTHRAALSGIPATGRSVEVTGMSIERIVGGRIVEGWVVNDALGMLQQLGVIAAS